MLCMLCMLCMFQRQFCQIYIEFIMKNIDFEFFITNSGFILVFVLILCNAYCKYTLFCHVWSASGQIRIINRNRKSLNCP